MQPPGAAIVCATSAGAVAKLEKLASWASGNSIWQAGPSAPGAPSVSTIAVAVRTSGKAAGVSGLPAPKSRSSLPAATAKVTPAAVALQTNAWSAFVAQVLGGPGPPRLMLAT